MIEIQGIERLKEIIKIAHKLGWINQIKQPNVYKFSYPPIQLSEVEKCMIAMYDDSELNRMRKWEKEVDDGTYDRQIAEAKYMFEKRKLTEVEQK